MGNQNAWNNFQKEMAKLAKLKGSEVEDVREFKKRWKAMSKEEKEKYGLKDEKLVGPRITCSDSEFVNKLKGLGEERCRLLETYLKDNPFKSLLEMNGGVRNRKLILYLVSNFDTTRKSLHINGCDYIFTPKDFTSIMGIEDGDEEIDLKTDPSEELKEVFSDGKTKQFQVSNIEVLKLLKDGDMNLANKAYSLFSLFYIVSPPGRSALKGKYLNNLNDMKKKKWATHAIDTLVQGIASFKEGKGTTPSRLGGCVLFLQLFYMSKACVIPLPKEDVHLLKYFKKKTVDDFLKNHETLLFKEREDVECSERVVEHGEKKPKKQKVIDDEEVIAANSLNLAYKAFEKQLKIFEEEYPHNGTSNEIKKKMASLCKGTKKKASKKHVTKTREDLMVSKKPETTQNEETILVGPFHVRTTAAPTPTAQDKILLEWIFERQHKEEEEAEVASVVSGCFPIQKKEMTRLGPQAWLSSFIINLVVEILCLKELNKTDLQRWYFMVDFLLKDGIALSRILHLNDCKKLKSVNQLFFPIAKGEHFFLIVVSTQEKRVEVWDTLKKSLEYYQDEFKKVVTFLDSYIIDDPQESLSCYTMNVVDIPQQDGNYDCGVFCCYYLEFPEDVHKFRKEKWISEEERCQLCLRILKSTYNTKKEQIYQCAEKWFKGKKINRSRNIPNW